MTEVFLPEVISEKNPSKQGITVKKAKKKHLVYGD
jgi:hypothetical protein